jgi:hypothetical protein
MCLRKRQWQAHTAAHSKQTSAARLWSHHTPHTHTRTHTHTHTRATLSLPPHARRTHTTRSRPSTPRVVGGNLADLVVAAYVAVAQQPARPELLRAQPQEGPEVGHRMREQRGPLLGRLLWVSEVSAARQRTVGGRGLACMRVCASRGGRAAACSLRVRHPAPPRTQPPNANRLRRMTTAFLLCLRGCEVVCVRGEGLGSSTVVQTPVLGARQICTTSNCPPASA